MIDNMSIQRLKEGRFRDFPVSPGFTAVDFLLRWPCLTFQTKDSDFRIYFDMKVAEKTSVVVTCRMMMDGWRGCLCQALWNLRRLHPWSPAGGWWPTTPWSEGGAERETVQKERRLNICGAVQPKLKRSTEAASWLTGGHTQDVTQGRGWWWWWHHQAERREPAISLSRRGQVRLLCVTATTRSLRTNNYVVK